MGGASRNFGEGGYIERVVNFSTACLCGLVRQRILGLRDAQDGSSGRQLPAVGRSMACWRSLDLW